MTDAAIAALAAHRQGKFWEMHDKLFANQKKFAEGKMKELAAGWAKEIGLDVEKFKKDMNSDKAAKQLKNDTKVAGNVGANGTPTSLAIFGIWLHICLRRLG